MKDRVPTYPGRVKLTPVAGQENTYDMERADSPTQEGTPLNKETLLTDTVAALLGLSGEATVNDMLAALAATTSISRGGSGQTTAAGALYAFIDGATALATTGLATGDYLGIGDVSAATGKKATIADLADFLASSLDMTKITVGSYVGTGKAGSSNPCTLAITFAPKLIIIVREDIIPSLGVLIPLDTTYNRRGMSIYYNTNTPYIYSLKVKISGNTVTWNVTGEDSEYNLSAYQLNSGSITYNYVALG